MFKIESYLKPFVVTEMLDDLRSANVRILACIELDAAHHSSSSEPIEDYTLERKIRIDVLVETELLDEAISILKNHLGTRLHERSEIVVMPVTELLEVGGDGRLA